MGTVAPRYPLRDREWLTAEYVDRGRTQRAISQELGVSTMTVLRALRRVGIETRGRWANPPTDVTRAHLTDPDWLYGEYVLRQRSIPSIATELRVADATVHNHLRRSGIPRRSLEAAQQLRWARHDGERIAAAAFAKTSARSRMLERRTWEPDLYSPAELVHLLKVARAYGEPFGAAFDPAVDLSTEHVHLGHDWAEVHRGIRRVWQYAYGKIGPPLRFGAALSDDGDDQGGIVRALLGQAADLGS
jgi:hypothetical protein